MVLSGFSSTQKFYSHFFLVLLYFFTPYATADNQHRSLELKDAELSLSVSPFLEVLEDPTRKLSFSDVTSSTYADKFQSNRQASPSFGRTHSAYWVRFGLINQSERKWYLLLDAMLGDELNLYIVPEHPTAYAQKVDHYRRAAWSLTLPKGENLQVYIRATNGDSLLNIPVELLSADAMLTRSNQDYLFHGGIYAAELMLAAYNIFLIMAFRDMSYLALVVHILAVMLTIHRSNPVFESLFFLSQTNHYFFTTPMYFVIASLAVFARKILQTKDYSPSFDLVLKTVFWSSPLLMGVTGAIPQGTRIPLVLLIIVFTVVLAAGFLAAKQGKLIAKYFFCIFLLMFFIDVPLFLISLLDETRWIYANENIFGISTLIFVLLMSLIQAERMREMRESMQHSAIAGETKDRFMASMSHELRTPLNAIFGISTLLRLSHLDNTQRTYVEKLEASTRHMLQLIGNILDIKKIENKSFQLDIELFNLKSVITSLNDILKAQAEAKNLAMNFTGWENITENLYGDKLRLTQILINLLNNAIKFTEFGNVSLHVQRLTTHKPGMACLHFTVSDTGVGIGQDKLQFLFQPFMPLKKRSHSFREGAGLGLAISKNLVDMMGGSLEVKSMPGAGSQFFFSLNFGLHDRRSTASLQDRRKNRGMHGRRYSLRMQDRRKTLKAYDRRKSLPQENTPPDSALLLPVGTQILLVDDYELNLFIGQKLLAKIGGEVAVAGNGQSAIIQLQQHRFDIVLLDLSMADMDGFEVTNWIRSYGQQPNVPIIALTAQATPAIEQQCRDSGMNGFLTKPFTLNDLYNIILKSVHDKTPSLISQ